MILRTLASSSSGNCTLVQNGKTALLIDAGISCQKITRRLRLCGLSPSDLSGILITHEHTDHVIGLRVLLKGRNIAVYATPFTCEVLSYRYPTIAHNLMSIPAGSYFDIGGLTVTAFSTPHDSADSVGYVVSDGVHSVAFATDLGTVTDCVLTHITGANTVLLEANHDLCLLQNGDYPHALKERILGSHGHLCNDAAAQLAVHLAQNGTSTLILAHLSKHNNTPALAFSSVQGALNAEHISATVHIAPADELSECFAVE